jgi:hypothetical protein
MRHSQKGMSFFGWLAVIFLLIFGVVIAMKLIPIYMDHFALRKMVTAVNDDPSIKIKSLRDFNSYLDRGMQVNSIRDIKTAEAVTISVSGQNAYTVTIAYERRAPLLQTLDLLVHFDETHIVRPLQ